MTHAELETGPGAEKIIDRLKEIADGEKEHEDKFRNLIGSSLGGEPTISGNSKSSLATLVLGFSSALPDLLYPYYLRRGIITTSIQPPSS